MVKTGTLLFFIALMIFSVSCTESDVPTETTSSKARSSKTKPMTTTETTVTTPSLLPPADATRGPSVADRKEKVILLNTPTDLAHFEVASQALQQWYNARKVRPALVLYSNDPFLRQTTPLIQKNLLARLENQEQDTLRFGTPNLAVFPEMTVDAALQTGLFSAIYWVMPAKVEASELSVEIFRQQMMDMGALNNEEARTFTLRDGVFSGTVRGVPFHALNPQSNIVTSGPVAFHFDLSYLSPLYKTEMKTPIYPLIYQILQQLRDQQIQVVSTSFSYSQINGKIPLGSRFIGDVLSRLFKQPVLLDESLPSAWQQRANARHLIEMLNIEMARNIFSDLAAKAPEDGSLDYSLYQVSRQARSTHSAALVHLAKAVQSDPVYANEYLYLAPVAEKKGRKDEALRVLGLAREASPENPFISLELARAYVAAGQNDRAVPLLQQLQSLKWSPLLYPDMPEYLQQLLTDAGR